MLKTLVNLNILFFCLTILNAQPKEPSIFVDKNVTIVGKVIDKETQLPLEYASVAFFSKKENKIVDGGITDINGEFSITVKNGIYDIAIEYISYKKITFPNKSLEKNENLGTISMEIDYGTLDAVEIIAERTTVEIKLDKKIYNIGKDLTTAGGTVSDALNNVPSVSVDIDGAISLRGNENVRILINGRPSALAGFGDSNVLSQLPAEAIERVEVITSPSARYDAEGTAGILNIILRQKETLGFNGAFNFTVGNPDNVGLSANLNYRTEKFNVFSNFGWRYFDAPRNSFSDITRFDRIENGTVIEPQFRRIIEDEDVERLNRNYNANVGLEYFLSDKSSITGSIFYRLGSDADLAINKSERINNDVIVEETLRREKQTERDNSYQIAVNYRKQFGEDTDHTLTADFQYEVDKEEGFTSLNEDYILTNQTNPEPFQIEQETQNEDQTEYLFQADYVLPLGEDSRFEAGYRGNFRNEITNYILEQENLNSGLIEINDIFTNVFDYDQNVNALYSQYGSKLGKFSFLLGLRLEHTQLKGNINSRLSEQELQEAYEFPIKTQFDNNYLGLFPTLNLIFNIGGSDSDSEESITIGYNRRINRPRGWFLNPVPSRSSRTNVFQGNPNLEPAFANAVDLGYLKRWEKLTLTSSIYYQKETNSFERIQEETNQFTQPDNIQIVRSIPINLSTESRIGAELGVLYNPSKNVRFNSSFNFFQFETDGEFNGVDFSAKNTSWFARFSSNIKLPWSVDWQTNANYRGARQDAQTDTDGIFSMDVALSKEIWDGNGNISLNARDLFNSRRNQSLTTTEFFERYSESQWRQRQINLSFIYRFNQQKKRNERRYQNQGNDDDFDYEG